MASTPPSAVLQNVYYERKAGTERPCYICRRPTATVLATIKTDDFLYTCEGHLSDPGLWVSPHCSKTHDSATVIAAPPSGPSAEDIRKVISEYNAREAQRAKAKDKDDKDEKKDGKKDDKKSDAPDSPKPSSPPTTGIPSSSSPAQTHRKFALHRALFESRKAEMRRREQSTRAKEVSKGLPQVPRGSF